MVSFNVHQSHLFRSFEPQCSASATIQPFHVLANSDEIKNSVTYTFDIYNKACFSRITSIKMKNIELYHNTKFLNVNEQFYEFRVKE